MSKSEGEAMSLDVYLEVEGTRTLCAEDRIFVRENGSTKEITREEWDRRFPDRAPITTRLTAVDDSSIAYTANITHNLNKMAAEAGIYKHLWRPDEIGIRKAKQLIEPLCGGLKMLAGDPGRFKALNPPNGWGTYRGLIAFVASYLEACVQWPEATVSVSR
jgi:hypothetical protein